MTDPRKDQVALPANYMSPYALIRHMQIHQTWLLLHEKQKVLFKLRSAAENLQVWCAENMDLVSTQWSINERKKKKKRWNVFKMSYSFLLFPSIYIFSSTLVSIPIIWQNTELENKCAFYDPLTCLHPKRQPHKPNMRPAWDITKQQMPHSISSCSMCCLYMHSPALPAHPGLPLMVKAFVIWCWLINSNGNTYTYREKNTYQSF